MTCAVGGPVAAHVRWLVGIPQFAESAAVALARHLRTPRPFLRDHLWSCP
jgi:hypothetical protein